MAGQHILPVTKKQMRSMKARLVTYRSPGFLTDIGKYTQAEQRTDIEAAYSLLNSVGGHVPQGKENLAQLTGNDAQDARRLYPRPHS